MAESAGVKKAAAKGAAAGAKVAHQRRVRASESAATQVRGAQKVIDRLTRKKK